MNRRKFIGMTVSGGIAAMAGCKTLLAAEKKGKPNIIFILADDLGYGDVHCLNPKRCKIKTPNMDRLAEQGMILSDAHSSSAVCTPTRYGVLTGRYNWRTHLQKGVLGGMSAPLIDAARLTVAGMLKKQGYATACVGKWHLGMTMPKPLVNGTIKNSPTARGFDYYFGISASLDMAPYAFIENDKFTEQPTEKKDLYKGRMGPAAPGFKCVDVLPMFAKKAGEWINSHKSEPFFLYMPLNSPHTPLAPTEEWKGKSGLGDYADFVMETDWAIGQVVKALETAGVAENTLVMLTSDNGCAPYIGTAVTTPRLSSQGMGAIKTLEEKGHFPSAQFRGYKSDGWDGGHRVPFIASWPGVVKPGSNSSQLVCLTDLMATCADITGAEIPANAAEDSVSILPLLKGVDKPVRETAVHHSISGKFAIREGKWKLLLCSGSGGWANRIISAEEKEALNTDVQLYDMSKDEGERNNLQDKHPDIVKRMTEKLQKIVADGRSTPGPKQKNDVPVDIFKRKR